MKTPVQVEWVMLGLGLIGGLMGIDGSRLSGEPWLRTVSVVLMAMALLLRVINRLILPWAQRRLEQNMPDDPQQAMQARMRMYALTVITDILNLGVRSARMVGQTDDHDPLLDDWGEQPTLPLEIPLSSLELEPTEEQKNADERTQAERC